MADLTAIRVALANALATIPAPDGGTVQTSPYALQAPTAPGVQVVPGQIDYGMTFADFTGGNGSFDHLEMKVQAFVDYSTDIGPQVLLDAMLAPTGASSVKALIEADQTLDGSADGVKVTTASGYRTVDRAAGGQMLMVEFTVEVHTTT